MLLPMWSGQLSSVLETLSIICIDGGGRPDQPGHLQLPLLLQSAVHHEHQAGRPVGDERGGAVPELGGGSPALMCTANHQRQNHLLFNLWADPDNFLSKFSLVVAI